MLDRDLIKDKYPWLFPTKPQYFIIGDDLDAIMSATLLMSINPNFILAGVYVGYEKIYFSDDLTNEQLLNDCIFIDLDINHSSCRSFGHHIVRFNETNKLKGFSNSCNLNELVGDRSVRTGFIWKCPINTLMCLMWLFEKDYPNLASEALFWLGDSCFINGQKYKENMEDWVYNIMTYEPFISTFKKLDTIEFEKLIQKVQDFLRKNGFNQGHGQIISNHLKLTGFQCQPNENEDITFWLERMIRTVCKITKWKINKNQLKIYNLKSITGERYYKVEVNNIRIPFDEYLEEKNIFSHVFLNSHYLNYTSFNF